MASFDFNANHITSYTVVTARDTTSTVRSQSELRLHTQLSTWAEQSRLGHGSDVIRCSGPVS